MILDTLTQRPGIGIGTSVGSAFLSWIPAMNPILSFISLCIGILVGITTLYLQIKGIINQ